MLAGCLDVMSRDIVAAHMLGIVRNALKHAAVPVAQRLYPAAA